MRRFVMILFCWLSLCAPLYAANFVEIIRDGNYIVYVDIDSIESRTSYVHEYVVAWVKWIYGGDSAKEISKPYKETVDSCMDFMAFNKKMKQVQTLSLTYYDKNSNIIDSDSWPFKRSDYEEITPETYGEALYDFVMSHYNKVK